MRQPSGQSKPQFTPRSSEETQQVRGDQSRLGMLFCREITRDAVEVCAEMSRFQRSHSLTEQCRDQTSQHVAGSARREAAVARGVDGQSNAIRDDRLPSLQQQDDAVLSGELDRVKLSIVLDHGRVQTGQPREFAGMWSEDARRAAFRSRQQIRTFGQQVQSVGIDHQRQR